MYIEKKSFRFNTQQRFAEHTGWSWVYRSLDYVLCHSFLGGYRGSLSIYLLWKSTNIQYSALTPRLITPIIGHAIYCFSFLFKVKNVSFGGFDPRPLALSSSVWSNVLCLRFHKYQPYMYTKLCIPPLVHLDYLISKVVNINNCIKTRYKVFKNNIYKKFVCRNLTFNDI